MAQLLELSLPAEAGAALLHAEECFALLVFFK